MASEPITDLKISDGEQGARIFKTLNNTVLIMGGGQLGEKNKNAKLTKDKVRVIRYLRNVAKFSLKDIAWQFDVSVSAISEICSGRNWGWLSTI